MEMLFALFGGLAMFLYGMDRMSRALQRAAGDAMKRLLARLTATPLLGVLTGLAVTAVLQSSSAATVMVIGFVSAGLLELPRAVAVIYGINIGTTMTAQLIAFDVQTLVYPVLFLGFLLDFAACRPRWRAVGEAVFSFGLLFEGIDILGRALQPLAGQAVFLDWMTRVKESPLLGILLGLSMTMVVQSSSATIALLQNVARQAGPDGIHSVLGLAGAVPVLLGDNIGTTVTALLACIGQGKDAARAALAHSCFNLSGSLLAAVLLLLWKHRWTGMSLSFALILDLICCNIVLKPLVGRVRPFLVNTAVELLTAPPADASFPSGHTAASFAAVFALRASGSPLWKPALVLAAGIAFSRLYLYVHWPTDVLGGILVGAAAGWAGARLADALRRRRERLGRRA